MRPTTPNLSFSHQAEPSSPPQTPNTPSFQYRQYKTRRNGMFVSKSSSATNSIEIPRTSNPSFYNQPSELSPRSSSPTSSIHSSNRSSSPSPPRSLSSSPGLPTSPLPTKTRIISATKANFTVEEFGSSDYEDFDSDVDSIIRPTQYEDAESDRGAAALKSVPLDPKVVSAFNKLCASSDNELEDSDYAAREAYLQQLRMEKRRKRRSSASFKRTLAQSIGSDTDDEDLIPGLLDANDAGSSARRLRRKTMGERSSLIFDDPPPSIEELEEPESCEEVVEVHELEEVGDGLPYWVQEDMDLDSSSGEESDEN